jgi:hypothetical protein
MARKTYVLLFLFILLVPLLVKLTGAKNYDYVLNGSYIDVARPAFSSRTFLSANYQEQEDIYLQQSVAFKGFLIALNNQADYSLFGTLHYTIEMGGSGQLFLWNHVDNHCGDLSISEDSLRRKITECQYLKSMLDSMHIPVVFVLAPGKPSFMEDKLPAKYRGKCSNDNDYHHVLSALNNAKLPVIDYNEWFRQNRGGFKYPAFPRLGIHWSYYAACLVMDSLVKYVARISNRDIAVPRITNTRVTDKPYKTDKDLWSLLNLLVPMQSDSLAYPEYNFSDTVSKVHKPKIVIIGDSYSWVLLDTKLPANIFSANSRYWFYKKQLYDLNGKWITDNASTQQVYQTLQGADMVIFLSTEVLNYRLDFELANWLKANPPERQMLAN